MLGRLSSDEMSKPDVSEISQEVEDQAAAQLELPPGFRFHPSDEELISFSYYLTKSLDRFSISGAILEVDLNVCEPWDLPAVANLGVKEWYVFCHKDRKYPTGKQTNRATQSGYWKATGSERERSSGVLVGKDKEIFRDLLSDRGKMGEQEWYFSRKDRKHTMMGMQANRATENGYRNRKATRKDKEFVRGRGKKNNK